MPVRMPADGNLDVYCMPCHVTDVTYAGSQGHGFADLQTAVGLCKTSAHAPFLQSIHGKCMLRTAWLPELM